MIVYWYSFSNREGDNANTKADRELSKRRGRNLNLPASHGTVTVTPVLVKEPEGRKRRYRHHRLTTSFLPFLPTGKLPWPNL